MNPQNSLQVCWLCGATKGMEDDVELAITCIGDNAAWRQTYLQSPPWQVAPHYSRLIGFDLAMIVPDLLHCWNLGVLRDVLGSSLKIILGDRVVFNAPTLPDRLVIASQSLKRFARQHRFPLRMKKMTKGKIGWGSRKYPELASSGYDSFVVSRWLEQILQPYEQYQEICSLLWAGNQTVSLLQSAKWFLTPGEKNTVEIVGSYFCNLYLRHASAALQENKLLWRIKPKFHLFCHVVKSPRHVNHAKYATWLDEDFLKKIGKVLGLTSQRTAQKRMLQRWLLSIPQHLNAKRWKKNLVPVLDIQPFVIAWRFRNWVFFHACFSPHQIWYQHKNQIYHQAVCQWKGLNFAYATGMAFVICFFRNHEPLVGKSVFVRFFWTSCTDVESNISCFSIIVYAIQIWKAKIKSTDFLLLGHVSITYWYMYTFCVLYTCQIIDVCVNISVQVWI